jgi:hypothetical protein
MASRRNFLKSSGAAAAVLGTMGLAGCSDLNPLSSGGGGSKNYKNWMYDPSELVETEFVGFGTFNVQVIFENEDQLPEETVEELDEAGQQLESFGVDLDETERITSVGHTGDVLGNAMSGGGGGEGSLISSGGSAAITGSFETSKIEEAVTSANNSVPENRRLEEDGEYSGYNMWTTSYEQQTASGQTQTVSGAAGLSEDALVASGMQSNEASAREAAELMIDTQSGSGTRLTKENDDVNEMVKNVGGNAFAMGTTLGDLVETLGMFIQEEAVSDVIDGLVAVGVGTDINGETYETNIAMVYGESSDASTENYDAFFEYLREQNTSDVEDPLEDIETSKNGRTVVVTTTGDTEELFSEASDTGSGSGSTESGSDDGTSTYDIGASVAPYDVLSLASPSDIVAAATPGGGVDIGN